MGFSGLRCAWIGVPIEAFWGLFLPILFSFHIHFFLGFPILFFLLLTCLRTLFLPSN